MASENELLERVFPVYLSDASKERLSKCFAERATNLDYHAYGWEGPKQPLQGDGWSPLWMLDFDDGKRREVAGIVMSNTCDIDTSNPSMRPRNVVFAPLIKVADYRRLLVDSGFDHARVDSHLETVRRQEKTEIFYIPASQEIPECLVMLDDVHSQPLPSFLTTEVERRRLFRLNNFGFYMFLMKLSIHFTRFGEKLDRASATA